MLDKIKDYKDQFLSALRVICGYADFVVSDDGNFFHVKGNEKDIFTIHKWLKFPCGDFTITIFILGESHAVMIMYKSQIILFEICACTEVSNRMKPVLLKDMADGEVFGKQVNGHTYAFKKRYLNQSELEEMYDFFSILSKEDHVTLLEYNFCEDPNCGHDVEPMTKVLVNVDKENKKNYIYSIHVYPDEPNKEQIAVLTETVVTVNI